MKFERQSYIAGKTILVREKVKRTREKGEKRAPKTNITIDQVWESNLRQAIFELTLKLNTNFRPGDWNLKLTFEEDVTLADAKQARDKFTRKLRDLCKARSIELKWIIVPHVSGKRCHFHFIANSEVPLALIKTAWTAGLVIEKAHLWDNPNYYQMASYLMHEARELRELKAGETEVPFTKRYSGSRNLDRPELIVEDMQRIDMEDEPRARKGFIIDGEVQRYENLINGAPCREYIQVSIEDNPRIRKWKKATKATGERMPFAKLLREAYQEYQLELFDMDSDF